MASQVEIVNDALSLLGDEAITSIDDDTTRARLAKRFYADTVDSVLRSHPWNCAVKRQALALLVEEPVYDWDSQFSLPSDCLRVLSVNDYEEAGFGGDTFRVEGRKLLVNNTAASIRYIKRMDDPNEFDSLLKQAISAKLAAKMAYAITGSLSVGIAMAQNFELVMREARTVDGQESTPEINSVTILTDVR